jgi:hypothetical protein
MDARPSPEGMAESYPTRRLPQDLACCQLGGPVGGPRPSLRDLWLPTPGPNVENVGLVSAIPSGWRGNSQWHETRTPALHHNRHRSAGARAEGPCAKSNGTEPGHPWFRRDQFAARASRKLISGVSIGVIAL